jgi:hypothetical protein
MSRLLASTLSLPDRLAQTRSLVTQALADVGTGHEIEGDRHG